MLLSLIAAALIQSAPPAEAAPDGVFRARGYSWLIQRGAEGFALYHQAGEACWPDPDAAEMQSLFERRAAGTADGIVGLTEAGRDDQATVYPFEVLPALPEACAAPDAGDRAAGVAVADLMLEHYPAFAARGVDFSARRIEVLAALPAQPTPDQAWTAAEALLAGLDDPHIDLATEIDGEEQALATSQGATLDAVRARPGERPERAWLTAWREGVEATILDGQGHAAGNNRLFWGVRDGVGYLTVLTMGGFDPEDDAGLAPLDAALDQAMAAFAGTRAVIVDVSNNRGGYDSVGRHIAGRFAEADHLAYTKRGSDPAVAPQAVTVRPSPGARYTGPVWLLTSDVTVSAGETFAQMMRVLPNVTHAGTATRGAFSDQTPVPLANGWVFAMPMELYVGLDGRPLEGRGLEPEVRIDLYPSSDLDQGHAAAVRALMARLAVQP